MSEVNKVFLIILYVIMFAMCFYWKKRISKAEKLLSHYVDESYYCNTCMDGDDSCQCAEVREFLKPSSTGKTRGEK